MALLLLYHQRISQDTDRLRSAKQSRLWKNVANHSRPNSNSNELILNLNNLHYIQVSKFLRVVRLELRLKIVAVQQMSQSGTGSEEAD